jgi:hypothetical protein
MHLKLESNDTHTPLLQILKAQAEATVASGGMPYDNKARTT